MTEPEKSMTLVDRFWRTVGSEPGRGWREVPGNSRTEAWVRQCGRRALPWRAVGVPRDMGYGVHPRLGSAMTEPELIDILSERQWNRMTRSGVTWADLTEHDRRASRAIVAPILADLRAESQTPWMIASALSLERVLNSEPSRDEAAYDEAQIRRGMRDDQ